MRSPEEGPGWQHLKYRRKVSAHGGWGAGGVSEKGRTGSHRILEDVPRSQDFYSECDRGSLLGVKQR